MTSIRLTPIPVQRDAAPPEAKGEPEAVPVDRIIVPDGRRPPRNTPALAESIAAVGLLNPITLTPEYRLIAGGNRLAACQSLGWTHIPSVVVALDGLRAELAELDENLIRHELSALERGEALARRKALYEALHPETRPVSERGGPGRGKGGPKTGADPALVFPPGTTVEEVEKPTPPFTLDTAAKTGRSRRTVQTEVQIAEGIAEDLRDAIRGTPLADRKDDLLKLARLDPGRQEAVVAQVLADPKLTIPQARRAVERDERRAELAAKAAAAATVDHPAWDVLEGANVDVMATLEPGSVRLVFADIQYNIGVDYGQGAAADRLPDREYLDRFRAWIPRCRDLLTPDGSFWLLVNFEQDWRLIAIAVDEVGFHFRQRITWYETFGVNCTRKFNRCSRALLWFVKDPERFVFNAEAVTRPSDRQVKYETPRSTPPSIGVSCFLERD